MNTATFDAHSRRFVRAALQADLDAAREVLARHPELVHGRNNCRETPLHYLAVEDCRDGVELLFNAGAAVDTTGTHQESTPLYDAAGLGLVEIVQLLIRHGAGVNRKQTFARETALHAAARHARTAEIVDVLIAAGADINARDHMGRTPLHEAVSVGNARTARRLIELGADVKAIDELEHVPKDDLTDDAPDDLRALFSAGG